MTKRAILLADMRSDRIVNGSGHIHALAKVGGIPLLIRNLRTLQAAGIEDVVVVTGYGADRVRNDLENYHVSVPVTVVHNDNWSRGTAHSLLAASGWIDQPVVLVPSEHLYPPSLIRRIMYSPVSVDSVVMTVDRRMGDIFDAGECVQVRTQGNLVSDLGRHMEQPDGVFPGIIRISPTLIDILTRLLEDVDISLMDSLRAMARRGRVRFLDVENACWIRVSSPQARRYAELLIQLHGDTLETQYTDMNAILLNPGPVRTSPRVKAAVGARDMCHREPVFSRLLLDLEHKLRIVFGATEEHDVLLVTSSGTGAMESAVSTFVPSGKKIMVLANGAFGERICEICRVYGMETVLVQVPWGEVFPLNRVEAILSADPDIAAVAMVHHETSMAVVNPLRPVGEIARRYDRILIVDAVSSLGAEDLDVVKDYVDVCVSSANKCLHAFSGVAPVCVSARSWKQVASDSPRNYYLDLRRYRDFMKRISQTPFTPGVNTLMSLNAALDELLDSGLASRRQHYRQLSGRLRSGLRSLGLEMLIDSQRASRSVTNVKVPDGLTYADVYEGLKSHGFVVYESKGELAGRYFQVANMGALEEVHVDAFLGAIGRVVADARRIPALSLSAPASRFQVQ